MKTIYKRSLGLFTSLFSLFILFAGVLFTGQTPKFSDIVSVGAITTGLVTERIDIDYYKDILIAREKNNFLTWLMREVDEDITKTPLTGIFELKDKNRVVNVSEATAATSTTGAEVEISLGSVSEANSIPIHGLLTIKGVDITGNYTNDLRVISRDGDTITVVANKPGRLIPIIAEGAKLFRRTNSYPQNAMNQEPIVNKYEKETQPTHIFRTPFGCSKTVENQRMYGGNERAIRRLQAEIEHIEDIEYAYLLNSEMVIEESDETSNIHRGVFKGIIQRIKDNKNVYNNLIGSSGGLDLDVLRGLMTRVFSRKSVDGNQTRRVCLHNQAMGNYAWGLNQEKVVTYSSDKIFGQSVDVMKFAGGELVMVEHPLLSSYYDDPDRPAALIVHPRFIKERFMDGRKTQLRANIQEAGRDGILDEFLTESVILMGMLEMQGFIDPDTIQA